MASLTRLAFTVFFAVLGGFAFVLLSLPLPWMLGSMCAVAALAVGGKPVVSVKRVRSPLATIIGVTLGSSFSAETFVNVVEWLPLTAAAIVSTVLIGIVGPLYLRRVARFDHITGFFAAMPAGVYEMTSQGGLLGGIERQIALVHAVRIFTVVLAVPVAFRLLFELDAPSLADHGLTAELGPGDALVLALCALAGWPLAHRCRLPNPALLGPLVLSALAHITGLTDISPPPVLVGLAQVFLGASIGGQFIGTTARELVSTAFHGLVLMLIMLAISITVAFVTAHLAGIDVPTMILAVAPGGAAEMSFVALALGAEVPSIVAHQLLRVVLIHGLAVWAFNLVRQRGD